MELPFSLFIRIESPTLEIFNIAIKFLLYDKIKV